MISICFLFHVAFCLLLAFKFIFLIALICFSLSPIGVQLIVMCFPFISHYFQSFQLDYPRFKIQSLDPNTCFKARAFPSTNQNTWFEIKMDEDTGAVTKTCGDVSKQGCNEGNTW